MQKQGFGSLWQNYVIQDRSSANNCQNRFRMITSESYLLARQSEAQSRGSPLHGYLPVKSHS